MSNLCVFSASFSISVTLLIGLKSRRVDTEQLMDLLKEPKDIVDVQNAPELVVKGGAIKFDSVHFSYDGKRVGIFLHFSNSLRLLNIGPHLLLGNYQRNLLRGQAGSLGSSSWTFWWWKINRQFDTFFFREFPDTGD